MSYIPKTINDVIKDYLNRMTFLPAIQREFEWKRYDIEKLFDSIMGDYPISTFLFWKIKQDNKDDWAAYEFIRAYDKEAPHNTVASLKGVNQDIYLVLDGQQRLTSLFIGLKGSYEDLHYGKNRKTQLYLNILKKPEQDANNPEELVYQFKFRENDQPDPKDPNPQLWYLVGNILDFDSAEKAKQPIKQSLSAYTDDQKEIANTHIGELYARIHTYPLLNYYEEKSNDYDKVVEAFIRVNTGGRKLQYSNILLSTATAKWKTLDARKEIHDFTDEINKIGNGYTFEQDFVLKGCLYLTDGLDIKYKIANFNSANLAKIENNWDYIKTNLHNAISLIYGFGFNDRSLVTKNALLPIALYLGKLNKKYFIDSTDNRDVENQNLIQKWFVLTLLKGVFGGSSDKTLKDLQDVINAQTDFSKFPFSALNKKLGIDDKFNDAEIERLLETNYGTKYSYLILSLLYPNRNWKGSIYHEDHIFPKKEFTQAKLQSRNYPATQIDEYSKYFNSIINLQLLINNQNTTKNAKDFATWLANQNGNFKAEHLIPNMNDYGFDHFLEFIEKRKKMITDRLHDLSA